MSRIFIALTPNSELKAIISDLKNRQRKFTYKASKVNWSNNHNFHITINFVGEMEPEQKQELFKSFEQNNSLKSIPIEISHLSYFPNESGQVFVANITLSPRLKELYEKVEQVVSRIGFGMSLRTYKPHISLARFKEKNRPFGEIIELEKPIASLITSLDVYESESKSGKILNTLIKSYKFE